MPAAIESMRDIRPAASEPADRCGSRTKRLLVYAPTGTSALLLAFCLFLPFGLYGGCGNNPLRPVSPLDRQTEALASSDYGSLIVLSLPYLLALAIAVATLVTARLGGKRTSLALSALYSGFVVLVGAFLVESAVRELLFSGRDREGIWVDHGFAVLSAGWLLCMTLAAWVEAPSRFVCAMLLQMLLCLIIWLCLAQWFLFLDRLLIGGWLTIVCAVGIPLGTALQLYGDPSAARQTARERSQTAGGSPGSGTPQFTLRGLLAITTLCAVVLSACQTWNIEVAVLVAYVATTGLLAVRRIGNQDGWRSRRVRGYALAACLLAAGALTL